MAAAVGSGDSTAQLRVFVLVDNDSAKGVFLTWDAAEAFADEHDYSLDHLMEYFTRRDYPDHLHLMAAKWENTWIFQGEWTNQTPKWEKPPQQIRLEHYHCNGTEFRLLRRREFDWDDGLLQRINPMAPDDALESSSHTPSSLLGGKAQWQPKVAPLKPLEGKKPAPEPKPDKDQQDQPKQQADPDSEKPSPPASSSKYRGELPKIVRDAERFHWEKQPEDETTPEQEVDKSDGQERKSKLRLTPPSLPKEETDTSVEKTQPTQQSETKAEKAKKSRLKLKGKIAPTPIPTFQATPATTTPLGNKSSVELAHSDPHAMAGKKPVEPHYTGKPKKILSLKLILTLIAIALCWSGGLYWVLRPEPTAASIIAEIATLNRARTIVVEPEMVFFQFEVSPVHQERYIQNLGLEPIDENNPVSIPTYHTLSSWEQPLTFIRPPYADSEVDDWWKLKKRDIRYGFIKRWEDGSVLILDFESDTIIGWAQAKLLPEILI